VQALAVKGLKAGLFSSVNTFINNGNEYLHIFLSYLGRVHDALVTCEVIYSNRFFLCLSVIHIYAVLVTQCVFKQIYFIRF
jgi:hypothetical protein